MTRVLLLAEQLRREVPGGIGTYVRGLVQGLRDLDDPDVEVTLFASRPPAAGLDELAQLGFPLRTSRLSNPLLNRAWDSGLLAAPKGFDVVHATSLAHPRSGAALGVTVHDVAWREVPETFPRRGRRWHESALRRAMARAQLVVVPSHRTAAAVAGAVGGRDDRVRVVPEGCDHLPPPDWASAETLLHRLGVVGPFVLSVSTLEPRKNLRRLVSAYRQARARLPERWPLVVVGPSGWGESLAPEPTVLLAGPVEPATLNALYSHAQARCLVYVPVVEGFGLPPVEAMAAGLPVVASPLPSTAKSEATIEVDPSDTRAITAAIVTAASNDERRAQLISAGHRHAARLTWVEAARSHVELWREVAG